MTRLTEARTATARIARWAVACALVTAIGLSSTACTQRHTEAHAKASAEAGAPTQHGTDPQQLVGSINRFGIELLRQSRQPGTPNTVVSPLSVDAALSMTANGATGQTRDEMLRVLHADNLADGGNSQWAELLHQLASRNASQTLDVANALWGRKDIAFKQPFIDADTGYFGAKVASLDFEATDAAPIVNGWIAAKTHGMITHVVDEVPSQTVMVLANAAYFKGDWIEPFDHHITNGTVSSRSTRASTCRSR